MGSALDKVIDDAKAALKAKEAARAKAKAKGKKKGKAKGKPKMADATTAKGSEDEGEEDEDEDEDESEDEREEVDIKRCPAAAAVVDAKRRPAAAAEGSLADAKKRPAGAAEGSLDDAQRDWKRFCKQIRSVDGLEDMFTAKEAKKDDDRNRYASRAYGKFPRKPKFQKIKQYCYRRAAEAWDLARN